MDIDLNELTECMKCGVIFNYTYGKEEEETDYAKSKIWTGKCPACKKEYQFFE